MPRTRTTTWWRWRNGCRMICRRTKDTNFSMTRFIVIFGFAISFAAGLVVGMGKHWSTPAEAGSPPATTHPSGPHGMAAELNLTPQQQEQMKKIWQDVARRGHGDPQQPDRRQQYRAERDEALAALVHPEDKDKYEQIQKDYKDRTDALDREMRAPFENAVKATDEILTPEQRVKYHEMLSRHQFDRGPHDHGDRG